jgi:hypothetical protein
MKIWENIQKRFCKHEFVLADLALTNIPELEKPKVNDYQAWVEYYKGIFQHESFTKRVKWPCKKCGKVFYAHCGIDIYHRNTVS